MEPPSSGAVAYRCGSHGAVASCRASRHADGPGTIDCRPSEDSGTIACPAEGPARPPNVDAGAAGAAPAMLCFPPSNLRFFLPTASSSCPPCLALVHWRLIVVVLSLRLSCYRFASSHQGETRCKNLVPRVCCRKRKPRTRKPRKRVMVRRGPMAMNQVAKISI